MSSDSTEVMDQPAGLPLKVCYSVDDAVAATGLSRATLYRSMAAGDLSYSQVGTRRRFLPEHLTAFLKRLEKNGPKK
ncbi:MAG TPA: helix-turn-helix domain-containing protein [Blastocatellia bacterium]|nr:helix-turn-helix domain-containing protein [Blastocatellia bacterium]